MEFIRNKKSDPNFPRFILWLNILEASFLDLFYKGTYNNFKTGIILS